MFPKYKHPPLSEVVCEFRFELENPFDSTLPGIIYNSLQDEFPIKKQRSNFGSVVPIEEGKDEKELIVTSLSQFYNKEENLLVQVGHNLFAVNSVKEYPHWEKFKPVINENYEKYIKIAEPKSITRIGLRCINRIYLTTETLDIYKSFNFCPPKLENIKGTFSFFNMHIETPLNDNRDVLVMKNKTVASDKDNTAAFLFDLEYVMNKPKGIEFKDVNEWLEEAHSELNHSFDASLSKELKESFNSE